MTARIAACIAVIILLTNAVMGGTLIANPSIEKAELNINQSNSQTLEVDFQFPGVNFEKVTHGIGQYDLLSIQREGQSGIIGAPEVPLITRLFAIPDRAKVKIVSLKPEYKIFQGVHSYPHQEYEYGHPDNSPELEAKDEYYRSGEIFPDRWVSLGEPAILRDYRIIPVTISPIRVNAATGEAWVLTGLSLKLEFEEGETVNVKTHHFDKTVPSFNKIYQNLIANYDWVNPNGVEVMGSILIVYPNVSGVLSTLQPYIEWKTRKGYNTIVRQVPNNTSTTTVMNQIIDVYQTADPPLEHVILVGDASGTIDIPCYNWGGGWYNGDTDHNYTQLEGGDILADVTIGRLSVDNNTTLQTAVNKIIYYERQPTLAQTDWYKKGALVAGSASSGLSTIQVNQNIRAWMLQNGYTQVDTLWYNMGGSIPTFMTSKCNNGISALNYRGYIGVSGFTTSMVYNLDNSFRIPYAVIITCGTGDFGSSYSQAISESWLRAGTPAQPKGGIAGIGTATSGTHTRYNNTIAGGLWYGVYNEGLTLLGESLFRGKLELYNAYQQDWSGLQNFTYWNNLMGDPTVDLWTDIPQVTEVSHPAEVAVGASSFTVTIEDESGNPLPDRYVCLWKENETYIGGRTDENGIYTAPISLQTDSVLKVTVTYHNDYPYYADVPVVAEDVYPSFNDLTIIDDNSGSSQGNGDGIANPSETLELEVELKNFGTSITATNISASLSSADPNVSITQSVVAYPALSPSAASTGNDAFVVEMSSEFPQGYTVQFALAIETDQGDFISAFDFDVNSGEVIPVSAQYSGGTLNPGDTDEVVVTIRNVGQLDLTDVTATISCSDPQITIDDNSGSFGNIPIGQNASNGADPFVISVDQYATNGRSIDIEFHLLSSNGCEQHLTVTISLGIVTTADPFGPDDYGYYCVDNADLEYSGHPTYEWIEIDPHYGGSGTELYLPDYSEEQDVSVRFPIPLTFTYYGEDFDTITVCSNGWMGMGNLALYDDFRNYPLPSAFGPVGGMICAFWDDLVMGSGHVYAYFDEAEHLVIVEWSRVDHLEWGTQTQTFEIILYDPEHYPTPTGDGEIVLQYQQVTPVLGTSSADNGYFTTGIQNIEHNDGLQYAYWNVYHQAAPVLQTGRAIKFTTVEPSRMPQIPSLEVTLEPANPPIVIPAGGGTFEFNARAENTGQSATVFDFWTKALLPDSTTYGPIVLRENLQLAPGNSIDRDLTQNVPGGAPEGLYTYTGYVGDYQTNDVWDADSFTFTKNGIANGGISNWDWFGWGEDSPSGDFSLIPHDYALLAAMPNPFNPTTEIRFTLPNPGEVKIAVYNSLGQEVAVLQDGWMDAGWHSAKFDGMNLSSGLYFYTIRAGNFHQTKKMLLVK